MKRKRRPPGINILPFVCNVGKTQKLNYKLNKRLVSKRIWLKSKMPNLKRNRAFLILFCCMRC